MKKPNFTIYSVSKINEYIKNMFANEHLLSVIFVRGEVSNCKYHSSGHIYFTLKDKNSSIACVMFAGQRDGLSFRMENGQEVIVGGSISVYERDGKYQLYARKIESMGEGVLYEKFERLKRELFEKGLFDDKYKKEIPKYSEKIGVVTARTGAVIQDIINVSTKRNPYVQLVLYPAKVQGDYAAKTIAEGIKTLDKEGVDVIIICRGGGSMEDLWAFNEEIVANAIFECNTPIISAVGHETDTTISDYVADMRAPTPSAAAAMATYDLTALMSMIYDKRDRLLQAMMYQLERERKRLENIREKIQYLSPLNQIQQKRRYLLDVEERLFLCMKYQISHKKSEFVLLAERLNGLSPIHKLTSGFAYIEKSGEMVKSIAQVMPGEKIDITFSDGLLKAIVEKRERRDMEQWLKK